MFAGIESVPGFARLRADERLTIGMAAYGNDKSTRAALESLFKSVEGDFELILVDDCSPDNGAVRRVYEAAAEAHRNTSLLVFPRNLEYTGSVNAILSHAAGERVLFVSNDIFVSPPYIRVLLETLDADAATGIARGCSNFVDNGDLPSHNVVLKRLPGSAAELFAIADQYASTHRKERLPDAYLTGDAFMVTRAVLDRIGTFDTQFHGYFPDHDFSLRARIAGFRPVVARGAFALHMQGANISYLPADEQQRKLERRWGRVHENWARFKLKYGLPVDLLYGDTSLNELPWDALAAARFDPERHVTAPSDYSAHRVERVAA
jgi:GT2 family glycosyltransferase